MLPKVSIGKYSKIWTFLAVFSQLETPNTTYSTYLATDFVLRVKILGNSPLTCTTMIFHISGL